MKMLVVDDDQINCQLLKQILQSYGDSQVTMDGEAAFSAFEAAHAANDPFKVIFLDIMMPKLDGHGLLTKIREWERENCPRGQDEVKIVMTSALDTKEHVLSSFKEGCEFYLIKPITRSKIAETMSKLGY